MISLPPVRDGAPRSLNVRPSIVDDRRWEASTTVADTSGSVGAQGVEPIAGVAHWVTKQHESGPIRLFAWEKYLPSREGSFAGIVLLVHGSSMASTPTFDLQVPGHGETHSSMDYFARLGYGVWCFDYEGYGRSDKSRDSKFSCADGADDTEAVAEYIRQQRGEYDGIAAFEDLLELFRLLPNSDKQFIVVPGAAHSGLHGKNFRTNFHIMQSYWSSQTRCIWASGLSTLKRSMFDVLTASVSEPDLRRLPE